MTSTSASHSKHSAHRTARLGVLLSGDGSSCIAIAEAIRDGRLPLCEIAVAVCNVPGAPGVDALRDLGLNVITLEGRGREQRDHEDTISALLRKFRVDLICLDSYKRVLSADFVREWKERILSSHLSLLPAFPGAHPVRAALDYGAPLTGCTVHFVEEHADPGPIVLQRLIEIPVDATLDSLTEALRAEEHLAWIEAIPRVLSNDSELQGRRYRPHPKTAADPTPGS